MTDIVTYYDLPQLKTRAFTVSQFDNGRLQEGLLSGA